MKGLLIVTYKEDKDNKEGGLPQFVKSTMPQGTEAN